MANIRGGIGGAAAGAGTGAAIGSIVPGIGTGIGAGAGAILGGIAGLFGGGDDASQQRIQMWQDAIAEYQKDPGNQEALAQLQELTKQGLTDQEKAELMQAATDAGSFAHGREGAVALDAAQRGGGVSRSGMTAGLEDVAGQGATQRYAQQTSTAAGQASSRRMAAIGAYDAERGRQQQMLAYMRAQLGGAYGGQQDYDERSTEAMMQNFGAGGSNLAGAYMLGKMPSPVPAGGDLHLGGTPLTQTRNPNDMSGYFYGQ